MDKVNMRPGKLLTVVSSILMTVVYGCGQRQSRPPENGKEAFTLISQKPAEGGKPSRLVFENTRVRIDAECIETTVKTYHLGEQQGKNLSFCIALNVGNEYEMTNWGSSLELKEGDFNTRYTIVSEELHR